MAIDFRQNFPPDVVSSWCKMCERKDTSDDPNMTMVCRPRIQGLVRRKAFRSIEGSTRPDI